MLPIIRIISIAGCPPGSNEIYENEYSIIYKLGVSFHRGFILHLLVIYVYCFQNKTHKRAGFYLARNCNITIL